jgi:tetratricopeptide (TPR) repeat protein
MTRASRLVGAAVTVLLLQAPPVGAQDSLAAARQLYASASYDEALAMLDRLKVAAAGDPAGGSLADHYRALCLLAVGRQSDAERAMEAIVANDPSFRPDGSASPRVQSMFRDVRRRVLPAAVRQRYDAAKASFDGKSYPEAIERFDAVLALLDAPEVLAVDPAFGDLRMLAVGFRDLAKAAAAPPPPPPVQAAPAEPAGTPAAGAAKSPESSSPPASAPTAAPPPDAAAPKPAPACYSASDAGVTPPVAVKQDLPRWPRAIPMGELRGRRAILDMVIGETGRVESLAVRPSITSWYDDMLAREAKNWSYKPALKDGQPVRYRRMLQVVVEQ